ncbi:STN domain-containing protein [Bradyrhizobium sp. 2TAF24]|uniref:STN domain-containing protein n=1 Tax=Bradyrhizobium sp. 2TAF24 TaxID=3233011 RepID=UPI003F91CB66
MSRDHDADEVRQRRAAMERWSRCVFALVMTVVAAMLIPAGVAHAGDGEPELVFDIPSQPLEAALDAYGAASRMQVLYETALTAGRRSAPVLGRLTREAALRRLLSGTGLVFNFTGEQAFTLVLAPLPAPSPPLPPAAIYQPFLGRVQAEVMAALCRRAETRPGASRLAFQFWISEAGEIRAPHLLASTGETARDAAVTAALGLVSLGRSPPAGMPQPVTMVLKAESSGGDSCGALRP